MDVKENLWRLSGELGQLRSRMIGSVKMVRENVDELEKLYAPLVEHGRRSRP